MPVRAKGKEGGTRFRLISYAPDTGAFKLYRGAAGATASNRPAELPAFRAASGALVGSVELRYRHGDFGPTLANGGSGDAERWFAEIVLAVPTKPEVRGMTAGFSSAQNSGAGIPGPGVRRVARHATSGSR